MPPHDNTIIELSNEKSIIVYSRIDIIYISLTGMQYFGNTKVKYHYSTFNQNPDIRHK
jgi:hypothetical protein